MADKKFIYNLKNNADFADKVKLLYGEDKLDYQAERYRKIYDMHTAKYGEGEFSILHPVELRYAEITPTTTTAKSFAHLSTWTQSLASLLARAKSS